MKQMGKWCFNIFMIECFLLQKYTVFISHFATQNYFHQTFPLPLSSPFSSPQPPAPNIWTLEPLPQCSWSQQDSIGRRGGWEGALETNFLMQDLAS